MDFSRQNCLITDKSGGGESTTAMIKNAADILSPVDKPVIVQIGIVLAGIVFLILASYITIPMEPVPITMQTFAVILTGALFGWRFGTLTVVIWLIAGAVGLPVLAGGVHGLEKFLGPTAGYLIAFPFAAAVVGLLVESGWDGRRFMPCFIVMLIGNALCLFIGAGWLGSMIGFHKALMNGIVPFLIGAIIKSALAAVVMVILEKLPRGSGEANG